MARGYFIICSSQHLILTVNVIGEPDPVLETKMKELLETIEQEYLEILLTWNGDRAEFKGLDELLWKL